MDRIVINLILSFVLKQIAKFKTSIDWAKVKADLEPRVRKFVPGEWFDNDAVAFVNSMVDRVIATLGKKEDLEDLLRCLANSDWNGALKKLKDLVMDGWIPTGTAEERAHAVFAAYKAAA